MASRIKKTAPSIGLILLAIGLITIANVKADNAQGTCDMPEKTIKEVLKEHTNELMSLPGVVGTAQGLCDDKPCIKVFVIKKTLELDEKIPDSLDGYPVAIEETGEFRALPEDHD